MDKFGGAATSEQTTADRRQPCNGARPRPSDPNGRYSGLDCGHLTRMAAIPRTLAAICVTWVHRDA